MHFYCNTDKGVVPKHFVPMTSDPSRLRPSRISDMRKAAKEGESWVPSVTTILNVLDKGALTNWKVEQHLKQAFKLRLFDPARETEDSYISEVKRLTELEMDKAPSAGTDFHKCMELFLLNKLDRDNQHYNLCDEVNCYLPEDGVVEKSFVSDAGFGGQVDFSSPEWLIDFKTKQTADKFKPGKMAYNDHSMQLAAYRYGLALPNARCANVFVCLEDGQIDFHEHSEDELQKGWKLFSHALEIWKLQNL